jgi:dolichol-phosphate mannosyltransferase
MTTMSAAEAGVERRPEELVGRLTFVLPAYEEAANLEQLLPRILAQESLARELRIIVVDDHSSDQTLETVRRWSRKDPRVSGIRLARNCGSHMAILSGLSLATGDAVVVLASDGQDPPEFTCDLIRAWNLGAQVVWAVRSTREGESFLTKLFSRLYYAAMNRWSFIRLPPSGADFFLLDRVVVDAVAEMPERNTSVLALITWLGFRQVELPYTKLARIGGQTKWTLRKKIGMTLDSFFGFSTIPLRMATVMGFLHAMAGFLYAAILIVNKISGGALFGAMAAQGWSALMVVLLISSGTVMIVLGIIGEYLWRALEEVRRRPRFVVEEKVNLPDGAGHGDVR